MTRRGPCRSFAISVIQIITIICQGNTVITIHSTNSSSAAAAVAVGSLFLCQSPRSCATLVQVSHFILDDSCGIPNFITLYISVLFQKSMLLPFQSSEFTVIFKDLILTCFYSISVNECEFYFAKCVDSLKIRFTGFRSSRKIMVSYKNIFVFSENISYVHFARLNKIEPSLRRFIFLCHFRAPKVQSFFF